MKTLSFLSFVASLLLFSCATNKSSSCESENQNLQKNSSILGMDISHFQNEIKWKSIKEDGINFVYIKATEGADIIDPKFDTNRTEAKNQCIYRGAYHFYDTGSDPIKQAENFITTIGQLESGDLPPVLDLEEMGITTPITKKNYQKNILQWLQLVEKELQIIPILYTNLNFGIKYLDLPEFAKYKLWIAEYTKKTPKIPETWKKEGWIIWQRTDREKLEGIKNDVDYDVFNGDAEAFRKLLKK